MSADTAVVSAGLLAALREVEAGQRVVYLTERSIDVQSQVYALLSYNHPSQFTIYRSHGDERVTHPSGGSLTWVYAGTLWDRRLRGMTVDAMYVEGWALLERGGRDLRMEAAVRGATRVVVCCG
jgi:hypothetical protein